MKCIGPQRGRHEAVHAGQLARLSEQLVVGRNKLLATVYQRFGAGVPAGRPRLSGGGRAAVS